VPHALYFALAQTSAAKTFSTASLSARTQTSLFTQSPLSAPQTASLLPFLLSPTALTPPDIFSDFCLRLEFYISYILYYSFLYAIMFFILLFSEAFMDTQNSITLDRSTYKKIKAMDRKQMEICLSNIYKSGINDAPSVSSASDDNSDSAASSDSLSTEQCSASACNVSQESIRNAISGVKGIGEARLNDIMSAVSVLFQN